MNLTLVKYAAISAILFGAGFGSCKVWKDGQIDQINLERKNERIAIERTARATLERHQAAVAKAQDSAAARARVLADAIVGNATELDRLRSATDSAMRAASSTLEASTAYAATASELLNTCGARLTDMAAKADGHASDVRTMIEAWPE